MTRVTIDVYAEVGSMVTRERLIKMITSRLDGQRNDYDDES